MWTSSGQLNCAEKSNVHCEEKGLLVFQYFFLNIITCFLPWKVNIEIFLNYASRLGTSNFQCSAGHWGQLKNVLSDECSGDEFTE